MYFLANTVIDIILLYLWEVVHTEVNLMLKSEKCATDFDRAL